MAGGARTRAVVAALLVVASVVVVVLAGVGRGTSPRSAAGFHDTVVLRGLREPLALAFARDGRVFVAEKRGIVKVFDTLTSKESRVFADLGELVFTEGDRGLFGLALDPRFPVRPFVYVLYTFDGSVGADELLRRRHCRRLFEGGCPVSGRLSRLGPRGGETVLLTGWCQEFPSHGVGALAFGSDGALYASGGEGARYDRVDTGQISNPCGDPPGEGGALRAQDASTAGDPLGISGSVVRLDPATGRWRLVAYGLRNPFRLAVRPGTSELWIGDVGSTRADELNVAPGAGSAPRNFGWPCYEGERALRTYDEANVPICERLYDEEVAAAPEAVFERDETVVGGDPCGRNAQALSGLAFYRGGSYPRRYRGALFFSDFVRRCIWAMLPDERGRPDPGRIELFRTGVETPVALITGPGGDLFYLDFRGGALHRIHYAPTRSSVATGSGRPTGAGRSGPG